ncbi:thioesterase family protein [Alteribacter aurantiacus]|uniref:thioesterase family protein n=1 Tax=Alteribacter aurantiacus TaxID=254410 RepID=UPI0004061DE4|nr:thioesterase family protein [Alteribacter aurantiacus]
MKPGMKIGQQATIDVIVTPEMYAQFEGNVVHPAYSTVSMVYHMEWAARQIILPFIEEHEEGIGASVNVMHLSPAPSGEHLLVTATLTELVKNKIVCDLVVKHGETVAGKGSVTQFILPKEDLNRKIQQARSESV